ncbi:MAG: MCE family protein [Aquificae bacterium]|nr:MCE family protein [Aquificota bacterium]
MQTTFKVGLFVLFMAGISAFLILTFGNTDFRQKKSFYYAYFDDVAGLSVGADVQVKGVKVGKVEEIKFEDSKIKVKFSVKKGIPIYKNARAYIKTYGLMGDKYLYVDAGTPDTGLAKAGEIIQTGEIFGTDTAFEVAQEVANKLSKTLDEINKAFGEDRLKQIFENINKLIIDVDSMILENRREVKESLRNIKQITYSLKENLPQIVERIDKIAKNLEEISTENKDDIKVLIANLRETSQILREKTPNLLEKIDRTTSEINELLEDKKDELKATIANMEESSKELKEILAKINQGKGTIGKLINEDTLYVKATQGIQYISKPFEILNKSRFDIVMFSEKHTGNEDVKGGLGGIFYPSNSVYYYAALVANSNGAVATKREIYTDTGMTTEVEKDFGLLIDLQYARRLIKIGSKELWFRGGLKESSAAVGLDVYYKNNIRLTTDLYRIGREVIQGEPEKPQFDIGLFYKAEDRPFFFRIGGSDLLNDKYRGMYFGVGFMFTEDYLKYFLGAASSVP